MTRTGSESNLLENVEHELSSSSHFHSAGCLHSEGSRKENNYSKSRLFTRSKSSSHAQDETSVCRFPSPRDDGRTTPASLPISRNQTPRPPSPTRTVISPDGKSAAATLPTRPSLPSQPRCIIPKRNSMSNRQSLLSPEMRRLISIYDQRSDEPEHISNNSNPQRRETEGRANPACVVRCVILTSSVE